jgi:hypothetical protein
MVIAADSQETVKDLRGNEFKYSVLKLKPEKMGNFQVLIAGGGNGDAIETFIEDCKQSFRDSPLDNLGDFKKAIQSKLRDCRKNLRSVGDDATMHLLIAAHIGTRYAVWKTKSYMLSEIIEADMIGFTDYLYQHTVKEFQPKNLPVTQLILLSLRVLDFARQTSTCVDQPYSVVIARANGLHVFDNELIKHYVDSIAVFGIAVNKLLLACGDTSMRSVTFEQILGEFSQTARHLRADSLQEAGERTFRRTLEPGYTGDPISVIPMGSVITYGFGSGGESVTVTEQSAEEINARRERAEVADEAVNKSEAWEEFLKLIAGNKFLFTDEREVQIYGSGSTG